MTGRVYTARSHELVDERRGDTDALVDWFNSDFGSGYICVIEDSQGRVVIELAYSVG